MIHPVSLVQAGMILVTVCIQITGKLSATREVAVTLPCSFGRIDYYDSEWYKIVIFCFGTLAPVSYYNGSDVPPCEADAPGDARSCIYNYDLNSTAVGVQSVILPAGVKVKIGIDEREPERLNGHSTPNQKNRTSIPDPEPGGNGTDPESGRKNGTDLAATAAIALVIIFFAGGSAVFLLICGIHYCRKSRRLQFYSTEREPNVNESGTALEPSMSSMHMPDEVDPEKRGDESQPTGSREPSISALTRNALGGTRSLSLPRSASCFPVLNYSGQNKEISTSEDSQAASRVRKDSSQKDTTAIV